MHHDDDGCVELDGAARDLLTGADGTARTAGAAAVRAVIGADGTVRSLDAPLDVGPLLGRPVRRGFRDALAPSLAAHGAVATPLALLLDDLPVAVLIAGYARLYQGTIPASASDDMRDDICSGWRRGGTMMQSVRAGEGIPVTIGPAAPPDAGDPQGWHAIGRLRAGSMRRRRLVDLAVDEDGLWQVTALFRDTYADADGGETVLHEYSLTAEADGERFTRCDAVPRVLPWVECPVAAASATWLIDTPVDEVRDRVRRDFRGTATCTHLNDLLRSLGDLPALARLLND